MVILMTAAAFLCGTQKSSAGNALPDEKIETRTIPVANFNQLICNIPCDVVYKIGEPNVEVSAPEKIVRHITASVKDHCLTLAMDTKNPFKMINIRITVTSRALCDLKLNGAVDFRATEGVSAENFNAVCNGAANGYIEGLNANAVELEVNGAGVFDIYDIESKSVKVTINGAGSSTVEGNTVEADLTINGAGAITAKKLKADRIYPNLRGLGKIDTYRESEN